MNIIFAILWIYIIVTIILLCINLLGSVIANIKRIIVTLYRNCTNRR